MSTAETWELDQVATAGFVVEWQIATKAVDGLGRTALGPRSTTPMTISSAGLSRRRLVLVQREVDDHQADRSAVFDAAQTIRAFARWYPTFPGRAPDEAGEEYRWRVANATSCSALQHTAQVADLLASIATDLTRLLSGERVLGVMPATDPDPASNRLDPDVVLAVLADDAERVARLLEGWPTPGDADDRTYGAMVALAKTAVAEGARRLRLAEEAFFD